MSFTIFLNSVNKFSGSNINNLTYTIDTTNIKAGKYKLSFSFRSGLQTLTDLSDYFAIFADFGATSNTITALNSVTYNYSNIIGFVNTEILSGTSGYFYSTQESNPCIYYMIQPNNNFINIQFRDAYNFNLLYPNFDGEYILGLEFELITPL